MIYEFYDIAHFYIILLLSIEWVRVQAKKKNRGSEGLFTH